MKVVRQVFIAFLGTIITGIGISWLVMAGQGVDPLSTFLSGIQTMTHLTLGTLIYLFNIAVVCMVWWVNRSLVGWGSVINAVFVGLTVNWVMPLNQVLANQHLPIQFVVGMGIFALGTGSCVYMYGHMGYGASEALMVWGAQRFHWSIRRTRMTLDLSFIIIGIILGAPFGYGTILSALFIGPVISGWMQVFTQIKRHQNRQLAMMKKIR